MEFAHFLTGIKFQFRLDTFEVHLHVERRAIVRYGEVLPNWHLTVKGICTKFGILESELVNRITMQEVNIIDYFKQGVKDQPAFAHAKKSGNENDDNNRMNDMGKFLFNKTAKNQSLNQAYNMNGRQSAATHDVDYFNRSDK